MQTNLTPISNINEPAVSSTTHGDAYIDQASDCSSKWRGRNIKQVLLGSILVEGGVFLVLSMTGIITGNQIVLAVGTGSGACGVLTYLFTSCVFKSSRSFNDADIII